MKVSNDVEEMNNQSVNEHVFELDTPIEIFSIREMFFVSFPFKKLK